MFAIYNERHENKIVRGNICDVTRGFVKETRSPCPPSTGMFRTGHAHLIFKFVGITCTAYILEYARVGDSFLVVPNNKNSDAG